MSEHDMVAHPDEAYYLDQYWHWLEPELERRFPDRAGRVVDIGCGQGRLAFALARWFRRGRVIGVDLTGAAIARARRYAAERNISNVEFHEGDALRFVAALPPASFDVALMIEVSFFMPAYREAISAAAGVLKPGGLFFGSFRSQYFDLLHSVRARDWRSAYLVRDRREGAWGGGGSWFSWHTTEDVGTLLVERGLTRPRFHGIGICSGIAGDPLASIAQPSTLGDEDRKTMMDIETTLAERYSDCGRYILAIAEKEDGVGR